MVQAVAICDWLMSGQYRHFTFPFWLPKDRLHFAIFLMVKGWSNSLIARQFIKMHLTYTSCHWIYRAHIYGIIWILRIIEVHYLAFVVRWRMHPVILLYSLQTLVFKTSQVQSFSQQKKKRETCLQEVLLHRSCFLQFHNFWKLEYTDLQPLLLDQTSKVSQLLDSNNLPGLCFFS